MCPAVNAIDLSALEALEEINTRLKEKNVALHLSEVKGPVMDQRKDLEGLIGNTPLVRLQRIGVDTGNTLLVKLEGQNPAGSVKDRPAYSMIRRAQARGDINPGDTLIEATSGNTGIALAMVAAMLGYRMVLIMPETMSMERRASMAAYGAELILVTKDQGMEGARDLAEKMQAEGTYRKKENSDPYSILHILENADFRAMNQIDIFENYHLVMAKKMHMWGNGL